MPCEQPVNKSNSPAISILSAIWILKLFTEKSHGGSACEQVVLTKSFQSEVWNCLQLGLTFIRLDFCEFKGFLAGFPNGESGDLIVPSVFSKQARPQPNVGLATGPPHEPERRANGLTLVLTATLPRGEGESVSASPDIAGLTLISLY